MAPTLYYRNITELQGILPGSLWQLQNQHFVLVDDDQHVIVPQTQAHHFQPATLPKS